MLDRASKESCSIDEVLRGEVRVDFAETARGIVTQVRQLLEEKLSGKQQQELRRLSQREFDRISGIIVDAFEQKRIGLLGLISMARRELCLLVLKKTIPKYSVDLLAGGVEPVEYFDRFYRDNFLHLDLPANGIGTVDPNLHQQLNKRGEFSEITKSLSRGAGRQGVGAGPRG